MNKMAIPAGNEVYVQPAKIVRCFSFAPVTCFLSAAWGKS